MCLLPRSQNTRSRRILLQSVVWAPHNGRLLCRELLNALLHCLREWALRRCWMTAESAGASISLSVASRRLRNGLEASAWSLASSSTTHARTSQTSHLGDPALVLRQELLAPREPGPRRALFVECQSPSKNLPIFQPPIAVGMCPGLDSFGHIWRRCSDHRTHRNTPLRGLPHEDLRDLLVQPIPWAWAFAIQNCAVKRTAQLCKAI